MNIGKGVKQLRKLKGITQGELAVKANISQTALSQIETNDIFPHRNTMEELAKGLDENMAVLFLYSLEREDCPENKRDIFDVLIPSVKALITATIKQ